MSCGSETTEPSVATLVMITELVENAIVGAPYSQSLEATGGTAPHAWTLASGSLPPGLDLNGSTGEISGVPVAVAAHTFTVRVTSADGQTATAGLAIEVFAALEITIASLPSGIVAAPYDALLTASGGDGTYAWTIVDGTLPSGLSLASATGQLSGTPTATGSDQITFEVGSGDGQETQITLDLDVYEALGFTTASLANAVQSVAYADTIEATGGNESYVWSIASGSLPSGLTLDPSNGVVSGTPTVIESATFTAEIESGDGQTEQVELGISVFEPLDVTTSSLRSGLTGQAYSDTLQASGGDGSHSWAFIAGSLPAGLALDPGTGEIAGTPTAVESPQATFQVSSGDGQTADVDLVLDVHGVLVVATTELSNAVQDVAYADTLEAVGGDGSNTWSLIAGGLPSGLSLEPATGVISGTPTTVETETFTVEVESADGQTAELELSVSVYPLLEVTTTALADGAMAREYADTLEAVGGDGVHSWSIVAGSLQQGLDLNGSSGEISGTPGELGLAQLNLEVSSGDGQTAQSILSITINVPILASTELCSDFPAVAVATFNDPNLEAAVRTALGIGAMDTLTCGLLATLITLDARSLDVADLTGIQNLTGARFVYLDDNSITDLGPMDGMAWIELLSIGDNAISDLDALSGLSSMTLLSAATNSISDLTGLQGLTGLETLILTNNSISDVGPLSGLTGLDVLWLTENQISDLSPLGSLTTLGTLLLTDNAITDVAPLTAMAGLTFLRVDDNPIGDLAPIGTLTGLQRLNVGLMALTDIGFVSGLTNLTSLQLNHNQLTDLSPLSGLSGLTELNLASNSVSDLGSLSGLTNLEHLNLNRNAVGDLSPLSGLTALTHLLLMENGIADVTVLEDLTALQQLLLTDNAGLADIQPLIDNVGLGAGDQVTLEGTSVMCADVATLEANGVAVTSDCP